MPATKTDGTNVTALASEMAAFSNSGGGQILIGVKDDGIIAGLTRNDMRRLNQLVSNAASQGVRPPITHTPKMWLCRMDW